jgi:hypothetical protein
MDGDVEMFGEAARAKIRAPCLECDARVSKKPSSVVADS